MNGNQFFNQNNGPIPNNEPLPNANQTQPTANNGFSFDSDPSSQANMNAVSAPSPISQPTQTTTTFLPSNQTITNTQLPGVNPQPISSPIPGTTASPSTVPTPVPTSTNNQQFSLGEAEHKEYADVIGNIGVPAATSAPLNGQFVGTNQSYNETSITDLNVDGTYNNMQIKDPMDYINDPAVQANINPQPKKTVTISKELKTVFILVLILFAFVFILPTLADLVNKARFR